MSERAPVFATFGEAWRWFMGGGELVGAREQRERFVAGRAQFLAFQVPVGGTPLADAAEPVADALSGVDGLRWYDEEMLHITLLGVGFQVIGGARPDEILREHVGAVAEYAAGVARAARKMEVRLGPVNVFPDALVLEVQDDGGGLAAIRRGLEERRADTLASGASFLPHVTLAMFEDPGVAGALRERLPPLRGLPPRAGAVRGFDLARWWFVGEDPAANPELDVVRSYRLR
ncbi:MAG: 2'-5' RNA ligase family protein [Chloroflexi bacterium]|nr:2'-5' RNA ligase family protein [Chloroflexota bacterium]